MKDILQNLDTGIYFLSDVDLAIDWQQLETFHDWMIFHVDGRLITNREIYLQTVAQALKSPDYCMYNFDAMLDCLSKYPRISCWCKQVRYFLHGFQHIPFAR